jgi:homoserine O-succinyltransferase
MAPGKLRIGVINLMPRAETYEPLLIRSLVLPGVLVELRWIRLESHGYRSSDRFHMENHYKTYDATLLGGALDGLVLTGAPVETLEFEAVHYWRELMEVLRHARRHVPRTLGICWGGMALAALEGIRKETLGRKVFGAFDHELSAEGRALMPSLGGVYRCAQSRHAGLVGASVEEAEREGRVRVLARGEEPGTTLLTSADRRMWMHLGHPEYEPERIAFEWSRDQAAGRLDVGAPAGFDATGTRPDAPWAEDARGFFADWLSSVLAALGGRPAAPSGRSLERRVQ